LTSIAVAPALAETNRLTHDTRFCPSWAEAHERTLASLNNGRPPYPVKWKGCIVLKRGTRVDIIDHGDQWTEIVVRGKHWFADEDAQPAMIPDADPRGRGEANGSRSKSPAQ
jgi:hypothetical protein